MFGKWLKFNNADRCLEKFLPVEFHFTVRVALTPSVHSGQSSGSVRLKWLLKCDKQSWNRKLVNLSEDAERAFIIFIRENQAKAKIIQTQNLS